MKKRKFDFWGCYYDPYYYRYMDWFGEFYKGKSRALDILKIRYAKGELNKDQYDKMKKEVQ